jgi:hypothetical protein
MIFAAVLAGCGGGASNDNGASGTVNSGGTTTSTAGTTTSTATGTTTTTSIGATTTTVGGTTTTSIGTGVTATTTRIVSAASSKCLDVTGGPTAIGNGIPIEQWTCSGQSNEAWTVKDMGNAQYEIIASNSGKCLDITNSNPASGTPIQQMDCNGQANQLWKLLSTGHRNFQLISFLKPAPNANQLCLSIAKDSNGNQKTDDGALIVSASCDYEGSVLNSWAMDVALPIKYLGTGKCLNVRGGAQATADGTLIEQQTCTGLSNQLWTVKDSLNNQYQIVASNSGKCLDLVNGGTGVGNGIQQSQCSNTPTQLWTTNNFGNGMTAIMSVAASGNCLDITGGSSAIDGANAQLTKCTSYELWNIGTPAHFP